MCTRNGVPPMSTRNVNTTKRQIYQLRHYNINVFFALSILPISLILVVNLRIIFKYFVSMMATFRLKQYYRLRVAHRRPLFIEIRVKLLLIVVGLTAVRLSFQIPSRNATLLWRKDNATFEIILQPPPDCPERYFLYRLSPGEYFLNNGRDLIEERNAICMRCNRCLDGIKVIRKCTQYRDVKCGTECVQSGYRFDEGTQSCQHEKVLDEGFTHKELREWLDKQKKKQEKEMVSEVGSTLKPKHTITSATITVRGVTERRSHGIHSTPGVTQGTLTQTSVARYGKLMATESTEQDSERSEKILEAVPEQATLSYRSRFQHLLLIASCSLLMLTAIVYACVVYKRLQPRCLFRSMERSTSSAYHAMFVEEGLSGAAPMSSPVEVETSPNNLMMVVHHEDDDNDDVGDSDENEEELMEEEEDEEKEENLKLLATYDVKSNSDNDSCSDDDDLYGGEHGDSHTLAAHHKISGYILVDSVDVVIEHVREFCKHGDDSANDEPTKSQAREMDNGTGNHEDGDFDSVRDANRGRDDVCDADNGSRKDEIGEDYETETSINLCMAADATRDSVDSVIERSYESCKHEDDGAKDETTSAQAREMDNGSGDEDGDFDGVSIVNRGRDETDDGSKSVEICEDYDKIEISMNTAADATRDNSDDIVVSTHDGIYDKQIEKHRMFTGISDEDNTEKRHSCSYTLDRYNRYRFNGVGSGDLEEPKEEVVELKDDTEEAANKETFEVWSKEQVKQETKWEAENGVGRNGNTEEEEEVDAEDTVGDGAVMRSQFREEGLFETFCKKELRIVRPYIWKMLNETCCNKVTWMNHLKSLSSHYRKTSLIVSQKLQRDCTNESKMELAYDGMRRNQEYVHSRCGQCSIIYIDSCHELIAAAISHRGNEHITVTPNPLYAVMDTEYYTSLQNEPSKKRFHRDNNNCKDKIQDEKFVESETFCRSISNEDKHL